MKVLYYTSLAFLDICLDVINTLKHEVDLHLVVKIPSNSSFARSDISETEHWDYTLMDPSDYLNYKSYQLLYPYFKDCASVHFVVYNTNSYSPVGLLRSWFKMCRFIRRLKIDIINLEDFTFRDFPIYLFFYTKAKIFLTVHDAIPHSGEKKLRGILSDLLLFRMPYKRRYFFFSEFSKSQFKEYYSKDRYPKYLLKMYPYTYYEKYQDPAKYVKKHILFFGRLSQYKGINVLLQAMDLVSKAFPAESVVIAGRSFRRYTLDVKSASEHPGYCLTFINRYVPTEELVKLIKQSKFVVCPYLDASQSGVLMTAFALNTPVVASNVGAFPEYIKQNVTGILVPPNDAGKLAEAIKRALANGFYEIMSRNISDQNKNHKWEDNREVLATAYLLQQQVVGSYAVKNKAIPLNTEGNE